MVEHIMGKGIYNNKVNPVRNIFFIRSRNMFFALLKGWSFLSKGVKGAVIILLFVILFDFSISYAFYREFELFDQGYEYYLSYQPEKAAETFNIFLREFPDSSAKDAAMFWLGKSLIHLKSFREAKEIFSKINQQFPDSPFIPYINRELEIISRAELEVNKTETEISGIANVKESFDTKLAEVEKRAQRAEKDLVKAIEDKDKLKSLLEEEKKKTEEMKWEADRIEGSEVELKSLVTKLEEQQKNRKEADRDLKLLKDENEKLDSEIQRLKKERALIENEREKLKDSVKRYEATVIRIKDKQYTISQILEFMINSSVLIDKLKIKEVLWRTGHIYEDFINEQILFDEAKRLNVIIEDMNKYKELVEKYNLKRDEADYLHKFLTISNLIDRKLKDMPEERMVESLLIRYTETDEYEKAVFATELRMDAKSGRSFEDFYRLYPDVVRFTLTGSQQLQGWIKDKVQLLQNKEISDVFQTKDGYIILRPISKRPSYRPFEDVMPEIRDEVRMFIKKWIDELRKEQKEIKIGEAE